MSDRNEIQPFTFPDTAQRVRVVTIDGEPWFVARDVAEALELGNMHSSLALLDEDERGLHSMETPSGDQQISVVNESGLYSLVLRSRKPEAKRFKRWVTHEVLPTIRKTGGYGQPQFAIPQNYAEALELAARKVRELEVAEAKVAEMEPKAEAFDAFMEADGTYSVGAVANMLGVGRNTLFAWLRHEGILQKDNRPYQRYAEHFKVAARTYEARGEQHATYTTYVRPSGAEFIRRRYNPPGQLTLITA
jgi:anti-repressor protein